jgi:hypothetical protein
VIFSTLVLNAPSTQICVGPQSGDSLFWGSGNFPTFPFFVVSKNSRPGAFQVRRGLVTPERFEAVALVLLAIEPPTWIYGLTKFHPQSLGGSADPLTLRRQVRESCLGGCPVALIAAHRARRRRASQTRRVHRARRGTPGPLDSNCTGSRTGHNSHRRRGTPRPHPSSRSHRIHHHSGSRRTCSHGRESPHGGDQSRRRASQNCRASHHRRARRRHRRGPTHSTSHRPWQSPLRLIQSLPYEACAQSLRYVSTPAFANQTHQL